MSHEHVLPSDMGYGIADRDDDRITCTCDCPDGEGQHLENCEAYLRYWELDDLERIDLRIEQIIASFHVPQRDRVIVDDLLAAIGRFVRSTRELGNASISDPVSVIQHRVRAKKLA